MFDYVERHKAFGAGTDLYGQIPGIKAGVNELRHFGDGFYGGEFHSSHVDTGCSEKMKHEPTAASHFQPLQSKAFLAG